VPVMAVFQFPGLTQEKYEEITRKLTNGKSRMESRSDWPVDGLLVHAAGQGENGFCVVDVWESEEAFRRFGETLVPTLQEFGVEGEPEVYPTHAFVSGVERPFRSLRSCEQAEEIADDQSDDLAAQQEQPFLTGSGPRGRRSHRLGLWR
jgi:hypothetical protein